MHKNNLCPVCGYQWMEQPAYDVHGNATFTICVSCGTEFGYDDSKISYHELRKKWIKNGKKWFGPEEEPKIWRDIKEKI